MYESFFGLREKPFSLTPNPSYLFLSKSHNEVFAHLLYGIKNRVGFVEVTGEIGTGKTTILRTLLNQLDENEYRLAFIFNPRLTSFELLQNINREFGISVDGTSNPDLIHELNRFLLEENGAGRTPVLVIDEAQNLSIEVLEQIRLLSNLETETDKLIQIILVGQPELKQQLEDFSLRQLNQRIAVRYRLMPMSRDETSAYIRQRLKVAGRPDGNLFNTAAEAEIYKASLGVPRLVNLIADRSLLTAYSEERGIIDKRDVRQAVRELKGMNEVTSDSVLPWRPAAVVTALVVIGVAVAWGLTLKTSKDQAVVGASASIKEASTVQVAPEPRVVSQPSPKVSTTELNPRLPLSKATACNALFALWESPSIPDGYGTDFVLEELFESRQFKVMKLRGTLRQLSALKMPLLLSLSAEQGGVFVAIVDASPMGWKVVPSYRGRDILSESDISALGEVDALIPWRDFAEIGFVTREGVAGRHIQKLQLLLGMAGYREVPVNGEFDPYTVEAVKSFQKANGLTVDGKVGPKTLVLLYQATGAYRTPRLG